MLIYARSHIADTSMEKTAPNILVTDGQAAVRYNSSGVAYSKPSAGSTTELFAGIFSGPIRNGGTDVKSETKTFSAGAGLTQTLSRIASGTTDLVAYKASGAKLTPVTVAPTAGSTFKVQTNGTTGATEIVVDAADVGAITIVYRYNVTTADFNLFFGHLGYQAPYSEDAQGVCAVILKGEICTTNFVTSGNWSTVTTVKAVAGGLLAPGDSALTGVVIPNAELLQGPTAADPTLTIRLN